MPENVIPLLEFLELWLSALVGVAGFYTAWGFWPLLWATDGRVNHISRAFLILGIAGGLRAGYWAFAPPELRIAVGGQAAPNIVFALMTLWGIWHVLKILHLTIPDDQRPAWSVLAAPLYPHRWRAFLAALVARFLIFPGKE